MSDMIEPRPNKLTPEMALNAARRVAGDLAKNGLIEDGDVEDSSIEIAKCGLRHKDGYQLAKALDSKYYWDCNLELAEALDGFSSEANSEIKAAEKDWATRNAIMPQFPVGTRVTLRKTGEAGEITGVYEYGAAKFLVKIDGDEEAEAPRGSRRIVNFEDVESLASATLDPAGLVSP